MHNIALLNRVMDHIDAHPAAHNQFTWVAHEDCGTVACFAGWTVLLHHDVARPDQAWKAQHYNDEHLPFEAEVLLGLDREEAAWMFCGSRTREQLRGQVDEWTSEAMLASTIDDGLAALIDEHEGMLV
jgi:hypothetical protein